MLSLGGGLSRADKGLRNSNGISGLRISRKDFREC